jgi:phage FluMu protein Com
MENDASLMNTMFSFFMGFMFFLTFFIVLFVLPAILDSRERKKSRKDSTPLFTHWRCTNCGFWLMVKEYKSFKKDKGCPSCKTSLLNYELVEVDTQQKYDEIMGY